MTLLEISELNGGYGLVRVLRDVSMTVDDGAVVSVLGSNGAGKTTLLRAISGMLPTVKGSIRIAGKDITRLAPEKIARLGVAHVPEGRGTFVGLTVEENLEIGAWRRSDRAAIRRDMSRMYELFPALATRRSQRAGSLSGGEQQMLAIGRALMSEPRLLLLDEPSLGLAPLVVRQVYAALATVVADFGVTAVVVEQNAHVALEIATGAHLMEVGRIIRSGSAESMRNDPAIQRSYLGV
ncbi:ABC transporter ATP-binding protein [Dactylosporangium sp. NPDC051485]|uniref:ABC transporter ATP-binding protein n=1 Tax=Dactylosporangium sp. NPDC051485 TaxID=3154846 RepID=UPI00343665DE